MSPDRATSVGATSVSRTTPEREAPWVARQAASFWALAVLLGSFLFAASAPSPLYPAYQARWHFSSITLTAVYAAYAIGALATLLTTGRLSDHVGRRRVTTLALAIQVIAMLAFIAAQGVEWLFAARILQGAATGIAIGAISAWLLDLQPRDDPRLGGLVGSIALLGGLALGALGSGLLAAFAPDPLHLVFWLLAALYAVALVGLAGVPDVIARKPGWLASMRPQVGVPPSVRSLFVASAPLLVAVWAVGGLYLALGPSLAISITGIRSPVVGGLMIVALLGTGALASALVRTARPETLFVRGSLLLVLGVGITLVAAALDSGAGLYVGSVVAGLGFGPAFSGIFRSLTTLAPLDRRAALVSAITLVVYVAFSVPTVIAGVAVSLEGLIDTTYAFGFVVMVLAATTTVVVSRRPATASTA